MGSAMEEVLFLTRFASKVMDMLIGAHPKPVCAAKLEELLA